MQTDPIGDAAEDKANRSTLPDTGASPGEGDPVGWARTGTLSIAEAAGDTSNPSSWRGGEEEGKKPGSLSETGNGSGLRHERFVIGRKLGEGGMGVVYQAYDSRDRREVALKVMKSSITGTARRRFEREFRSLSRLHHPHCLHVYEFGELDGGPFFTMDLFEGKPITSLVGRPLEEILPALLQVVLALDYIHSNGIIHRDIKPSNILVRPVTKDDGLAGFEAKVMDFGLAKYYGVKSSLSAEAGFVGTVAYCAPEQLNNDELDHRADLYCLGLVGYELLSGRYPFPEARLGGVRPLMRAQINDTPRDLTEINPDIPKPIADALARYLRKQARKRPNSAALLRDAITAYLKIDDETVFFNVASTPARPVLTVSGFVCRAQELEVIEEAVRRCLSGLAGSVESSPTLILAVGEPGIGKSSLVREVERASRGHGCQVYQGRCFDGNLSPFQPFVEILRHLIVDLRLQERREAEVVPEDDLTGTHAAGLPVEQWARLSAIVGDYAGEILRVAPELRKYLPGEAYRQIDFGRESDYIFRALSAFFIEVATLQPVCLSFEDIQWADKSSLDLLRHLCAALVDARRTADDSTAVPKLTIVASARTGYPQVEALAAPLRERRSITELKLAPLDDGETRELIALRLNCRPDELSDDLVARVVELCGGNPFFVSETIREWFEKAAITRNDLTWVLATQDGDRSGLPQTVREAMRLRVQGLSAKAQQVLGAAAVIGAVVDIDLLRDSLPDLSESDVLDALDMLIPRRVFRETGNAGRVEFVHDLLREFPYADLSAGRRRSLHRRVGELLEGRREKGQLVSPAVLAEHFRNAEDRPKAFAYELEAAQAAIDAYAFNNAVTHLDDALKVMPEDAAEATHYQLFKMLGTSHSASGRLDEAIAVFGKALGFANGATEKGRVHYGIGEAYQRKGDYEAAIRHFDLTLREAGFPRPRTRMGRLFDMGATAVYFHVLPHWCHLPDGGSDRLESMELGITTYYRLCQMAGERSVFEYTHASYRVAGFAKRSRRPEFVAIAYAKLGFNCGMFGLSRLGMHFIRVAQKAANSTERDHLKAIAKAHVGCAQYFSGQLDAAEASLQESVELLDRIGDWLGIFSHHTLRHLYSIRGDIPSALAEAEKSIAIATSRGNREILSWGRYDKADVLARAGRLAEAKEYADLSVAELSSLRSIVQGIALGVLGYARLQASDYAGAREALERSRSRLIRTAFVIEYAGSTFPLLVESLLGPAWAEPGIGSGRALARKAHREARVARCIGWIYPNCGAHALRVSGRAAQALGKTEQAARYFERAILAAEKLGARYDLARALLDGSKVIPGKAEEYQARGERLLEELGAVVPEAERRRA